MKVNMTPNPLDVVTIHASQGDTEARQWEFELHNNGELIDTSEITEQMVIKSYKGGTEQILPENTSTPTTSPFKGDIRYPQGLLTDQEFLYRESPTEEDGLAKITDIKGNTLVWNQQNYDNFTDTSKWLVNDGSKYSVSVSGNVLTVTCTGAPDNNASVRISGVNSIVGHKYLLLSDVKSPKAVGFRYLYSPVASGSLSMSVPANVWTQFGKVVQINSSSGFYVYFNSNNALAQGDAVEIKNHQIIDLTQMFGTTKADEIYAMEQAQSGSGIAYFKTYYPLPYYAYNQGTLLSFNGNGIKTVGKNKFNLTRDIDVTLSGVTFKSNPDKSITVNGATTGNATITQLNGFTAPDIRKGESLIWSGGLNRPVEQAYAQLVYKGDETGQTYSFVSVNNQSVSINANENMTIDGIYLSCRNGNTFNNETFYPMLRYADSSNIYEPYTSSTLSLPISTYFPNGMDGVGSDYDELTNIKATTRMARVDLGSPTWTRRAINEGYAFVSSPIESMIPTGNVSTANVLCPSYTLYMTSNGYYMPNDKTYRVGGSYFGTQRVIIRDDSYTDATDFKTAMSGVYLVYPLATPIETSFTTASLVTENAEIPLSNENGTLIGKCTEQLSSESGFFDAKIKLADADGECYSNKIQLHVERSPQ